MTKYLFAVLLSCIYISSHGQTKFKVKIDPRFEAISIFYTLATVDTLDEKPTPSTYYADVKRYFEANRLHSSLEWYRKLEKWDSYAVASFGIYLSDKHPFKVVRKVEDNYIRSASVDTFLYHLNHFYKEANVKAFLASHKPEYERIVAHAQDTVTKSRILEDVSTFFGSSDRGAFVMYLDILNNHGNNAITLASPEFKGKQMQRIAYLNDTSAHLTDQHPVVFNPYLNVVAHECSHTFVNDFIPKYEQRLYPIRKLFLTTAKGKVLEEKEWKNELDELIVRVCVAKILEQREGKDAGLAEIENQARHFKLAKPLYDFFNQYVLNRERYKTFEQFYPEVIAYLENVAGTNSIN